MKVSEGEITDVVPETGKGLIAQPNEITDIAEPAQKSLYLKDKGVSVSYDSTLSNNEVKDAVYDGIYSKDKVPVVPQEAKMPLIKSWAINTYSGLVSSMGQFYKHAGIVQKIMPQYYIDKWIFGKMKPGKEYPGDLSKIAEGEFSEAERLKKLTPNDTAFYKYSNDFFAGVGALPETIAESTLLGGITKLALVGKLIPAAESLITRIPTFAIGIGELGAVNATEKGKGPIGIATEAAEQTMVGTIYGKSKGLAAIPIGAALGEAESWFNALSEGRMPTRDEQTSSVIKAITFMTTFAAIPMLKKFASLSPEKAQLDYSFETISKHLDDGNLDGVKEEINSLVKSPNISESNKVRIKDLLDEQYLKDEQFRADSKESFKEKMKSAGIQQLSLINRAKQAVINKMNPVLTTAKKFGEEVAAKALKPFSAPKAEAFNFNNLKSAVFDMKWREVEKFVNDNFSEQEKRDLNLLVGEPQGQEAIKLQDEARERLGDKLKDSKLLDAVREAYDLVYEQGKNVIPDLNYFKDYFYGKYKNDKGQVDNFVDYWQSTEGWAKEKKLPTYADAVNYGLELKELNPIANARNELKAITFRGEMLKMRERAIAEGQDYAMELKKPEEKYLADQAGEPGKGNFYSIVLQEGGISPHTKTTSGGLGEEYNENVPVGLRNKNGLPLDEMADTLKNKYPHLGISDEASLLDYLSKEKSKRQTEKPKLVVEGKVEEVSPKDPRLQSWKKINDDAFKGMLFHPDYANLVNSLLSTNKITSDGFWSGIRTMAHLSQRVKFLGSLFHLNSVTKSFISDQERGLLSGKGYKELMKTGSFDVLSEENSVETQRLMSVGFEPSYSIEYQASQEFLNWVKKMGEGNFLQKTLSKVIKGARWLPGGPEQVKWLFQDFIPSIQLLKNIDEWHSFEAREGRPITDGELQDIVKTTQQIYGEMNERLYGRSSSVTSAMRLIFTAPGYGEGNFRTIFGAGREIGQKLTGKESPTGLRNARFITSSLITSLTAATIATRIMTGKWPDAPTTPEDLRDLFKIKTNMKDGNGDDVYFDLLTYERDYYSIAGNLGAGIAYGKPEQIARIPGDLGKRVAGATNPAFTIAIDLARIFTGGQVYDYKGKPIYYKSDNPAKKVSKLIWHELQVEEPISLSTLIQTHGRGVAFLEAYASGVAGVRTGTSEQVKKLKEIRSDLYALQNEARDRQLDIDKLYGENPKRAAKAAADFNEDQKNKVTKFFKRVGIDINFDRLPKVVKDKYIITRGAIKRTPTGTQLEGMTRKPIRRRRMPLPLNARSLLEEQGVPQ